MAHKYTHISLLTKLRVFFIDFVEDEVAVFVDVAHTTLGGDGLASEQAHCLLNVLIGYTPLLFEFDPEQADLTSFLKLCHRVWNNMKGNPELAKNLVSDRCPFVF